MASRATIRNTTSFPLSQHSLHLLRHLLPIRLGAPQEWTWALCHLGGNKRCSEVVDEYLWWQSWEKSQGQRLLSRALSVHLGVSRLPTAPRTSLDSPSLPLPLNTNRNTLCFTHKTLSILCCLLLPKNVATGPGSAFCTSVSQLLTQGLEPRE